MRLVAVVSLAAICTAAYAESAPRGRLVENVACQRDNSQTYTLYLPSQYSGDRRWPLLLIFDPRGRGTFAAEIFREPAEKYGWILMSSNNTRSDGPWEPNQRALAPGGAVVAWALAQRTQEIAGVIAVVSLPFSPLAGRRCPKGG
jgi:hypothetical protein